MSRHRESGAEVGVDPFFTARVIAALPARPLGAGLSPVPRLVVILLAHVLAGAMGYTVVVDPQSAAMVQISTTIGGLFAHGQAEEMFAYVGPAVLVIAALAVALITARAHTDAA